MPISGAAELESTLFLRTHHVIAGIIVPHGWGQTAQEAYDRQQRVKSAVRSAIFTELVNLATTGLIPFLCLRGKERMEWATEMVMMADVQLAADPNNPLGPPKLDLKIRQMCEYIWEPQGRVQASRVSTSSFLRAIRGETIQDDDFRTNMERRGLEEILNPPAEPIGSRLTTGRARMAAEVQASLKQAEEHRQKVAEEQKKIRAEEEKLEENGFGRVLELD